MAEQQGEDLNDENKMSEDEESDLEDEEEMKKGFIVDDDYLSVSEMAYSNLSGKDKDEIMQDLEVRKAMIKKNRESKE